MSDGSPRQVWSLSLPYDYYHSWGGSPHQKLKKKKFVLKWFLGNFKGFQLILKKKKINGKSVHCWPHPPTLVENSTFFFHKGPLAHNVSFWIQKLIHNVSFWIQNRNWHYLSVSGSRNWHIVSVSGSRNWSIISVSGSRIFLTRNWHSTSVYGSRNWCYGSVSGSRNWSITSVSGCLAIFLLLSFLDYNGLSIIICQAQPKCLLAF